MMTEATAMTPRPAVPGDAVACAGILNDWIDARDWMPRIHSRADVIDFYRNFVFTQRQVWVMGEPVQGFMAMDTASDMITALYIAAPGKGAGRAFVEHAKTGRDKLSLWTFIANEGARRFYAREGFHEIRRTDGENEEGLPDVLLQWERAA